MSVAARSSRSREAETRACRRSTGTPTPERVAHGDIGLTALDARTAIGALNVYRCCVGLYGLRRSGAIDDAQVAAAEMWARDYETGVLGASDPELAGNCGRGDVHDMMLARAAASERYSYIRAALGRAGERLLILLMIEGLSMSAMGERLQQDRKTIAGALVLLLEQLVEQYDGMPWSRKKD